MIAELFRAGAPTRIMAAINVSPESFFGGSVAADEATLARAVSAAQEAGAGILDLGAMSTAPYKETRISVEEETRRMAWAVEVSRRYTSLPISADTQRLEVARAAIEAGATIINDVSALQISPAIADLCARHGTGLILMASEYGPVPDGGNAPSVVRELLRQAVARATEAGVPTNHLLVDPGIGFFRNRPAPWHAWDLELLRAPAEWRIPGVAALVGASRKSLLKQLLGRENPADRLAGSLAIAASCTRQGIEWLRVHDVAETADVIQMTRLLVCGDTIDRGGSPP